MGGCREGGGETRFLTGAGVLLSCNLSSDSGERSKRGPARGPAGGRCRGGRRRVTQKEEKGLIPFPVHYQGMFSAGWDVSCSRSSGGHTGICGNTGPLVSNDPQPPSPHFVGVPGWGVTGQSAVSGADTRAGGRADAVTQSSSVPAASFSAALKSPLTAVAGKANSSYFRSTGEDQELRSKHLERNTGMDVVSEQFVPADQPVSGYGFQPEEQFFFNYNNASR
ncbi:hypothetical protein NQZ68_022566 [Dissostichus eleginoides]|nr:hypothetical protein NQZ68_022566 [Dissostichus eleginoides]